MNIEIVDLRRLFRNRFEIYVDCNNAAAAGELDGAPLTLSECAGLLIKDPEPFPIRYRTDLRKLRVRAPLNKPVDKHTYGDVATFMVDVLLKSARRDGVEQQLGVATRASAYP